MREREIAADERRAQARIERAAGIGCHAGERRNAVNRQRLSDGRALAPPSPSASCGRDAAAAGRGAGRGKGHGRGARDRPDDADADRRGTEAPRHRNRARRAPNDRQDAGASAARSCRPVARRSR